MRLSRRTFLKLAGTAAGSFALAGLWGCGNSSGSSSSIAAKDTDNASAENADAAGPTSTDASARAAAPDPADPTDNQQEQEQPMEQHSPDELQQSDSTSPTSPAVAVVYFSCTGNTQAVAEKVAASTGGELLRLEAAEPYTAADLNYNSDCRANAEQDSVTDRPATAQPAPDISGYDTVYLGYPIWWGKVPRVVLTYLESVDLAGKTVVPFCTSGSSGIGGSLDELHAAAPNANWREGSRFASSTTQSEIDRWVASLAE